VVEDRDFGKLEARVDRLERVRERFVDLLPLVATLGMLGALWVYNAAEFRGIDDRLDRLELGQARLESQMAEVLRRLPEPRP